MREGWRNKRRKKSKKMGVKGGSPSLKRTARHAGKGWNVGDFRQTREVKTNIHRMMGVRLRQLMLMHPHSKLMEGKKCLELSPQAVPWVT